MNKNKKNKNVNKILIISVVAIAIVVFGLAIVKSDILSNSRLFNLLRASIAERTYTVDDKRSAVVEMANAFKRRGTNIQYDTFRRTYLTTPEESTVDDVHYVDGASFVYSVYKQAFDIDVAPTAENLYTYAKNNKGSNYVVRYLTKSDLDSYTDQSAMYTALSADLKVGDIVVAARTIGTKTNYHAMLVTGVSGTTVTLTQALGKNIYTNASGTYSLDEENVDSIAQAYDTVDFTKTYYETSTAPAITSSYNLQTMLTNYYPVGQIAGYAVVRPLGSDGTNYKTYNGSTKTINLTSAAKARLEYKDIEITKTSNKHDNTTVNLGDTITYTISIKNNSSTAYSGVDIREEMSGPVSITSSDGTTSGNVVTWTNTSIAAGATKTITYTVKVRENASSVGSDIISTGNVDGISTGEINHFVANTLTSSEQSSLNTAIGESTTLADMSTAYKTLTGFGFTENSTGFDVDSVLNTIFDDADVTLYSEMIFMDRQYSLRSYDFGRRNYIDLSEDDFDLETFDENEKYSVTENNLIYGDIILVNDRKYIYTSNGLLDLVGSNNIATASIREFLDNIHARNKFAILRPSIIMPSAVTISSQNNKKTLLKTGTLQLDADISANNSLYAGRNTVTWTSSDTEKATVDANGLVTGKATGTVTITAKTSNGKTGNIQLELKDSLSSDKSLQYIKVYKNFSDTIETEYSSDEIRDNISTSGIGSDVNYIEIDAKTTDTLASYKITKVVNRDGTISNDEEGLNTITLYPGDNTITITVTAEDESTKNYTLKLTKNYTDSKYLSDLVVVGADLRNDSGAITNFSKTVTSYKANLEVDLSAEDEDEALVDIIATPELFGADVTVNAPATLVYGENTFTVVVKGVDAGTGSTTYTVKVTITEPKSNTADLAGIYVNENPIPNFNSNNSDYVYQVDDCNNIEVTYRTKKDGQTVETTEPAENDMCSSSLLTYTFNVTSEDGTTTRTYHLYVMVSGSSSAKLTSLTVKNGNTTYPLSPTFNSSTREYTVNVEHNVSSITISGTTDSMSTSNLIGPSELNVGDNVYYYTVTTYSGTEESSTLYTITIKRAASNQNTLSELSVSGYNIQPVFDKNVKNYTLTVDSSVESVYVVAAYDTNGDYRVIEGAGTRELTGTQTVLNIDVTPTGGDTNTYTITVTKLSSTSFEDLTVENGYLIIDDEMTVGTVKSKVGTSNNPKIKSGSTEITNTNTKVATGNTLTVNDQTYTIVVLGDYDQDGEVDLYDVNALYPDIMNHSVPTTNEAKRKAADFDKDGAIDLYDINALYDKCMGNN